MTGKPLFLWIVYLLPLFARPAQVDAQPLDREDLTVLGSHATRAGYRAGAWDSMTEPTFSPIRDTAMSFVTDAPQSQVAISFGADATSDSFGTQLVLRILVDGVPADPGEVVFAQGPLIGAHHTVFVDTVGPGLHSVLAEWRAVGGEVQLRNPVLNVESADSTTAGVRQLQVHSANDAIVRSTTSWATIPGLWDWVYLENGDDLAITLSGEMASAGGYLEVRARVENQTYGEPVYVTGYHLAQSRTLHFEADDLAGLQPGWNYVQLQWRQGVAGYEASMGARTMVLSSGPASTSSTFARSESASGWIDKDDSNWEPVPGALDVVPNAPDGELRVRFQADLIDLADGAVYVRAVVNGEVADPPFRTYDAVMSYTDAKGYHLVEQDWGTATFDFVAKHLSPGVDLDNATVQMQWRTGHQGQVWMGDRTLSVFSEPGSLPDLAEPLDIGLGIEPIGALEAPVLTVYLDSGDTYYGAQSAAPPAATIPAADDFLWGPMGVSDYMDEVSGGRLALVDEADSGGFVRPIVTLVGDFDGDGKDDGYDTDNCTQPLQGPVPPSLQPYPLYPSQGRELWMRALDLLDASFDFAAYDTNGDGVLHEHELAILFVGMRGSGGQQRRLWYCNGQGARTPMVLDGVQLTTAVAWRGSMLGNPSPSIAAHELMHSIGNLDDLYYAGGSSANAGNASLMNSGWTYRHLGGPEKLALGWVTPTVPAMDTWILLEDVKDSGEVLVLPRLGCDSREFYVLENRQDTPIEDGFDTALGDSGIAVWHVIDPSSPDAQVLRDLPPRCDAGEWAANPHHDAARGGVRLVRPYPTTDFGSSPPSHPLFWSSETHGGVLSDDDPGAVCADPSAGEWGDQLLVWADGTPSGYQVEFWSAPGQSQWLRVTADALAACP